MGLGALMHRPRLVDAFIVSSSMILILVYVVRNLPKPPRRPPGHPIPGCEPSLLNAL
jgi:hypothetical protein